MARMRAKKNIPDRLEKCKERWFEFPATNKGQWRGVCNKDSETKVFLEIGCGKGKFACETASKNPGVLYIAMERDTSVTLAAIEKAHTMEVPDLYFVNTDAQFIETYFANEEIDRIYINFCDPWSRKNKPKRRLTYRDYLETYKRILKPNGQIFFKTDDEPLFEFSLEEFKATGFTFNAVTYDLHSSEFNEDNVRTEFEQKFADQGIKIKGAIVTSPSK